MELAELERLIEMVNKSGVSELTLRQNESRVTIRRGGSLPLPGTALIPYEGSAAVLEETEGDFTTSFSEEVVAEEVLVTATLVGVFHHIKPLVGLGATVKEGQVIGVIEAMKLITEVTATSDGTVADVFVEDGMAVEYGQPLYEIHP